jgi:hypothetical protein
LRKARTRNQGDGVLAPELGGLEDVVVDRGHACRLSVSLSRRAAPGLRVLRVAIDGPATHREAGRAPRRSVCVRVSCGALFAVQWGRARCVRTCAVFWEDLDSIVAVGLQSSRP